jgi:site-specific recombinase XerD
MENKLSVIEVLGAEVVYESLPVKFEEMRNEVANTDISSLYTNTLTENTKMNYVSTIKEFFGVDDISKISTSTMQQVTPEIATLWANRQFEEGKAPSTINRKLAALHSFYKFLCRRSVGIMSYNPFSTDEGCVRFKNAQKDYVDKRVLTPQEVSKLLHAVDLSDDNDPVAYRDLIVLQILVTAGLRRAELCGVKIGDIRLNQGHYVIEVLGKGNKTRYMVLANTIKKNIDKYLKLRGVSYQDKDLPLIVSHSSNGDQTKHVNTTTIYRIVKKYADEAGIDADTIAPHNLRHTFATTAYSDLDMKPSEIQQLMGHVSSATTQRYIHGADMIKTSPSDKLAEMFNL